MGARRAHALSTHAHQRDFLIDEAQPVRPDEFNPQLRLRPFASRFRPFSAFVPPSPLLTPPATFPSNRTRPVESESHILSGAYPNEYPGEPRSTQKGIEHGKSIAPSELDVCGIVWAQRSASPADRPPVRFVWPAAGGTDEHVVSWHRIAHHIRNTLQHTRTQARTRTRIHTQQCEQVIRARVRATEGERIEYYFMRESAHL